MSEEIERPSGAGPSKSDRLAGEEGLSSSEVAERVSQGKTNANTDVKTKSISQILSEHTFTLFNGINVGLAACVAITGQWSNMLFMVVVICNLVVGVVQEIRAKRSVDRLSILTQKLVRVRRDGKTVQLPPSEIVLDDVILLAHGEQIPADSIVLSGTAMVDESLLTGEADLIPKAVGDELLSGSFVESGTLVARVERVGADGFAARINAQAKTFKPVESEILAALDMIIRVGTYLLFPLGICLFLRTLFMDGSTVNGSILTAVAAVVGMIPQGLVLLTSSVFAIATTRLAHRQVLVQQTYCVETLARVDTLCLDKTGTITTGKMEVSGVLPARGATDSQLCSALSSIVHANEEDANETGSAILSYLSSQGVPAPDPPRRSVAFSSRRKYSGCVDSSGRALVMGAASFVLEGEELARAQAMTQMRDGCERILAVCEAPGFQDDGALLGGTSETRLLGVVVIRDQIRPTAPQTIKYFLEQGVDLRVISGDDPQTASAIAARAGVPHAEDYVDASTLDTPEKLSQAAKEFHVFGRVTPEQKRDLVHAMQDMGHTVAMTGDGVNDVLALRAADCSISVASGSAAARNISEIVLADDDFSHMPEVVAEGRRSINNLQRSASLFLVKTVYTAVLALVCIVAPPYPFIPIQMSLISAAIIGVPSFVLALEPNHDRVSGDFLANVLAHSFPASAAIVVSLVTALVVEHLGFMSFQQTSTVCMLLVTIVGVCLIWRISQPLTPLRRALIAVVIGIVAVGCTVLSELFMVAPLTLTMIILIVVVGAFSIVLFNRLYDYSLHELDSGRLARLASRAEEAYEHRKEASHRR